MKSGLRRRVQKVASKRKPRDDALKDIVWADTPGDVERLQKEAPANAIIIHWQWTDEELAEPVKGLLKGGDE